MHNAACYLKPPSTYTASGCGIVYFKRGSAASALLPLLHAAPLRWQAKNSISWRRSQNAPVRLAARCGKNKRLKRRSTRLISQAALLSSPRANKNSHISLYHGDKYA